VLNVLLVFFPALGRRSVHALNEPSKASTRMSRIDCGISWILGQECFSAKNICLSVRLGMSSVPGKQLLGESSGTLRKFVSGATVLLKTGGFSAGRN
jgi:hypothetical protein